MLSPCNAELQEVCQMCNSLMITCQHKYLLLLPALPLQLPDGYSALGMDCICEEEKPACRKHCLKKRQPDSYSIFRKPEDSCDTPFLHVLIQFLKMTGYTQRAVLYTRRLFFRPQTAKNCQCSMTSKTMGMTGSNIMIHKPSSFAGIACPCCLLNIFQYPYFTSAGKLKRTFVPDNHAPACWFPLHKD